MCRYASTYKSHWVCFPCRKHVKSRKHQSPLCPHCGGDMVHLGMDFKAPRKSDEKQWKKVELLYRDGVRYDSCGCSGPGYRPASLAEYKRSQSTRLHKKGKHERRSIIPNRASRW